MRSARGCRPVEAFGIDYRTRLAQIITLNTDVAPDEISTTVFLVADEPTDDEANDSTSPSVGPAASPTPSIAPSGSAVAGPVATSRSRTAAWPAGRTTP